MGFSVSGATAIVLVGLIIGLGIAYPTVTGSIELINDAREDRADRLLDTENSDLEIVNATYDDADETLNVSVENTGTVTLSVAETDLLVDGRYEENTTSTVEGVEDAELWQPGERLNYTVDRDALNNTLGPDETPDGVKVVVETGLSDREEVE